LLTFFPTHMYVHMYTLTFGTCSEFSSMVWRSTKHKAPTPTCYRYNTPTSCSLTT
jgi:hypothetical protein